MNFETDTLPIRDLLTEGEHFEMYNNITLKVRYECTVCHLKWTDRRFPHEDNLPGAAVCSQECVDKYLAVPEVLV